MIIGILAEKTPETRVSLLPEHISLLQKMKAQVWVEAGAGLNAFATDEAYTTAGATVSSRKEVLQNADVIVAIHAPSDEDLAVCKGKVLLGFYGFDIFQ